MKIIHLYICFALDINLLDIASIGKYFCTIRMSSGIGENMQDMVSEIGYLVFSLSIHVLFALSGCVLHLIRG